MTEIDIDPAFIDHLKKMADKYMEDKVADLERENAKLRKLIEDIKDGAVPIYATSENTQDVKLGRELGGYVKSYEIIPHTLHKASNYLFKGV